jgi:hypothetical protein
VQCSVANSYSIEWIQKSTFSARKQKAAAAAPPPPPQQPQLTRAERKKLNHEQENMSSMLAALALAEAEAEAEAAAAAAAPSCIQGKTAGLCISVILSLSHLLSVYLSWDRDRGVKYSLLIKSSESGGLEVGITNLIVAFRRDMASSSLTLNECPHDLWMNFLAIFEWMSSRVCSGLVIPFRNAEGMESDHDFSTDFQSCKMLLRHMMLSIASILVLPAEA